MSTARKRLPIGIPTLSEIISDGYYYVDKTGLAFNLIERGKYYFLSRPRRFGKSLFIDTLKEIFEGNEALFQGLQIHPLWDWQRRHPVIVIDFSGDSLSTAEQLAGAISQQLEEYERKFNLPARYPDNRGRLRDLIARVHEQSDQTVVVLVDEYDKPILDSIEHQETALAMREQLKNLYGVLKGVNVHLRFVMLTGVSKFSKVNLNSCLDNLNDISTSPTWSSICGFTNHDVDSVFAPELAGLDREKIRLWYDGYNWRGESVYNPYDLLLLFSEREFHPWWFSTGTPSFLIKLMAQGDFFTPGLAKLRTDGELIATFDVDSIAPEALLYQAGYLTIRHCEQRVANWRYTLGFPNLGVEMGMNVATDWARNLNH